MIHRIVAGRAYDLAVATMLLAIGILGAFLLGVALPDVLRTVAEPSPSPAATSSPRPTPGSPMALSPIAIEMSPGSDCAACHVTSTGVVTTKPIPLLAHPLWGWRDCTACHAHDRLVETAPGHRGLHREDCLVCHRVPESLETPAPRPHHVYPDRTCISCHGSEAPLPTDMIGRQNCWVCHAGTEHASLFGASTP